MMSWQAPICAWSWLCDSSWSPLTPTSSQPPSPPLTPLQPPHPTPTPTPPPRSCAAGTAPVPRSRSATPSRAFGARRAPCSLFPKKITPLPWRPPWGSHPGWGAGWRWGRLGPSCARRSGGRRTCHPWGPSYERRAHYLGLGHVTWALGSLGPSLEQRCGTTRTAHDGMGEAPHHLSTPSDVRCPPRPSCPSCHATPPSQLCSALWAPIPRPQQPLSTPHTSTPLGVIPTHPRACHATPGTWQAREPRRYVPRPPPCPILPYLVYARKCQKLLGSPRPAATRPVPDSTRSALFYWLCSNRGWWMWAFWSKGAARSPAPSHAGCHMPPAARAALHRGSLTTAARQGLVVQCNATPSPFCRSGLAGATACASAKARPTAPPTPGPPIPPFAGTPDRQLRSPSQVPSPLRRMKHGL